MKTVIHFTRVLVCGALTLLAIAGCGGNGDDDRSVLTSVVLSTTAATIETGATQAFTATARDQNGTTMTGVTFTWSSSNTAVATVNGSGTATGVAAGTANITASAQGVTSTAAALAVVQATEVGGTAAQGAAIASATLTLKDSQGTTRTATTGADGRFTIRTTGLNPPFFLQVQAGAGRTLYSVSADANAAATINVTPLTDLIVRSWYGVKGVDVDNAFTSPASNPPPSPGAVELISRVVVQVAQLWLADAGIDTAEFSPISTPFQANGNGADKVLDQATVNTATREITITDGATTQVTNVSYDTDEGAIIVATTTTGPSGASSSSGGTVVPTSDADQAALAAINASLTSFAGVVNAKGAQLTATDVAPFISDTLLSEGLDKAQFAAEVATSFRGLNVSFATTRVADLDTTNGTAQVTFDYTITQGQQSSTDSETFFFKKVGSDWLLNGNQLIAEVDLHAEMRTNQGYFSETPAPGINVDVRPRQGTVSGVTISGGGIWTDAPLQPGSTSVEEVEPTPGTVQQILRDTYFGNSGALSELVPAGTPFTFVLTPPSGPPVTYTLKTNAFTTEAISITNPTGSTLADANLGQSLDVTWTLPSTYPIAHVQLTALTFTGDSNDPQTLQCEVDGPILTTSATSGTISIPPTCSGQPVASVNLNLSVDGVNGERNQVIYGFQ
jgi:Big-like domain-containing protein